MYCCGGIISNYNNSVGLQIVKLIAEGRRMQVTQSLYMS